MQIYIIHKNDIYFSINGGAWRVKGSWGVFGHLTTDQDSCVPLRNNEY